jgi:membrane-bound lytic murein transglycosylase D
LNTADLGRLIREYDGPAFGFASKNFYAEFLAAVEVSSHSELYFGSLPIEQPEMVERFVMPGPARFTALSKAFSISVEELTRINPALSPEVLNGRWAVPAGVVINVTAGLTADPGAAFAALSVAERRGTSEARDYRVRTGDTLSTIARAHGTSVAALQQANGLGESTKINAGQLITIPSLR